MPKRHDHYIDPETGEKVSLTTTIPLYKTTRDKLKECKIYYRETWDDCLLRLIEVYKKHNPPERRPSASEQ